MEPLVEEESIQEELFAKRRTNNRSLKAEKVSNAAIAKAFEKLQQNVILYVLTVRCWDGRRSLGNVDIAVEDESLDDEVTTGTSFKLVPVEWSRRLARFGTNARRVLSGFSVRFGIPGQYFVPINTAAAVEKQVLAIRDAYLKEAEQFISIYPDYVAKLRSQYPKAFASMKNKPPHPEDLRDAYNIRIFPMRIQLVEPMADDYPIRSFVDDTIQMAKQEVLDTFERMIAEPREELAAAAADFARIVQDSYDSGGKIRESSLNRLRRAVERFKSFGFIASREIIDQLNILDNRLSATSSKDVNDIENVRQQLLQSVISVRKACYEDMAEEKALGVFRREIEL